MKLLNRNLLKRKVLPGIAGAAALGLLTLSSFAQAQSPSPYAVETNVHGIYAYTQPPAGFDPNTASADELQSYGYPPRPTADQGPEALARWAKITNPALTRIVPRLVATNIYHRPMSGQIIKNKVLSSNWSGRALVHKKPAFTSVSGTWTVPTVQQAFGACSGSPDYSSEWVGIDGFSNDLLFQAGSEADADCDGGSTSTLYRPWIEWLPAAETVLTYSNGDPLPFAPGDYLIVTVTATGWTDGQSSTGTLSFTDVNQNWQGTLSVTAGSLGGTYVVGDSVEWIVERPEIGPNELATLANYVSDPWFDASATDINSKTYLPGTPRTATSYPITMIDNTNKPISFSDLVGSSNRSLLGSELLWFFDEGSALVN